MDNFNENNPFEKEGGWSNPAVEGEATPVEEASLQ